MDNIKVKNILIAVSNKPSIDVLLPVLKESSVKIWATEGTAKYIREKGFEVESIVSGFDFDGRVKSLDKLVLARVLADPNKPKHLEELKKLSRHSGDERSEDSRIDSGQARMTNNEPFDVVVVEIYKLDQANFPESMDIGGVTLIRAAIKNYQNVALAFDVPSIGELTDYLKAKQGWSLLEFRKAQAKKALNFIAQRCKLEAELF